MLCVCVCVEKMAIAAVAHIYVYPATPYQQHLDRKEQNVNSFDSVMVDEIEDLEIAVTSVKDSIQDVVIGGGGHVRILSSLIIFHEVISTANLGFRVLV